jgi:hypothetical protein
LTDFQIISRDDYLRNFIILFRKFDTDRNGILNEEEFINLIDSMKVYNQIEFDEKVNRLLNIIDPYNYKQIIFSNCVDLFSIETLEISKNSIDSNNENNNNNVEYITILDKISEDISLI